MEDERDERVRELAQRLDAVLREAHPETAAAALTVVLAAWLLNWAPRERQGVVEHYFGCVEQHLAMNLTLH